jgi:RsmE family RNA methyltransferase
VNIILFESEETSQPLPCDDARAKHILHVLRRRPGDSFDAGLIDGPRGRATLIGAGVDGLRCSFTWGEMPPPLAPISVVIGMPRPQTARRILQDATTLGVASITFVHAARGEAGYARSVLWTSGEWRRHLIAGAQQAFCTRLPRVRWDIGLEETLTDLEATGDRLALDNYEAGRALSELAPAAPVTLALGSESGWSQRERRVLREHGFELVHLGQRVLRSDTACVAAVTLVRAGLGLG